MLLFFFFSFGLVCNVPKKTAARQGVRSDFSCTARMLFPLNMSSSPQTFFSQALCSNTSGPFCGAEASLRPGTD